MEEKWCLRNERDERLKVIKSDVACCMMESEIRLQTEMNLKKQYKSDLTEALDLLDELNRKFPTKSINDLLTRFRKNS
jgi:hypothetical protein